MTIGFMPVLADLLFQAPEVNSRDSTPTFTTRTNLVLLRVVVRDKAGNAVGTLTKDDFQLFDKGKPQIISRFSLEKVSANKTSLAPGMRVSASSKRRSRSTRTPANNSA
jgi:hypothetical protein